MALKFVGLLLLWSLPLVQSDTIRSLCNVTCSTDYDVSLNCSCSGFVPKHPFFVQFICRNGDDKVDGRCEVKPPQLWCIAYAEYLYEVVSIGTRCSATASEHGSEEILEEVSEASQWDLSDVVKPQPPSDVRVTLSDGSYNISWMRSSRPDCMTYRVRVGLSKDSSKERIFTLMENTYIRLDSKELQQYTNYTVNVQAKMCPGNIYQGPWSEWSASTEWRTRGSADNKDGGNLQYQWIILAICIFLAFLPLALFWINNQNPLSRFWKAATYIPKAKVFFRPLYYEYSGNFKEWVKSDFTEFDYFRTDSNAFANTDDFFRWNSKKPICHEYSEVNEGQHFLHVRQPDCSLPFDGDSLGTGNSMRPISIHTVTLSGKEFEESRMSLSSLASYQDGRSFGSFQEDNLSHIGYHLESPLLEENSETFPERENETSNVLADEHHIKLESKVQFDRSKRISLGSLASDEQSDGILSPHGDLDTVDSGFVECSSPGTSNTGSEKQTEAEFFYEYKNSNSNYVKQWMICNAIHENTSNVDEVSCGTQQ